MPARVYWADPDKGSVSSTILQINRDRARIVGTVQTPDSFGIIAVDDNPACEVRVEQPDTRGDASRPITLNLSERKVAGTLEPEEVVEALKRYQRRYGRGWQD